MWMWTWTWSLSLLDPLVAYPVLLAAAFAVGEAVLVKERQRTGWLLPVGLGLAALPRLCRVGAGSELMMLYWLGVSWFVDYAFAGSLLGLAAGLALRRRGRKEEEP